MNRHSGSGEHSGHVGIGGKEIIEDATHLLLRLYADNRFELRWFNADVARVLRVEHGAIEHSGLIIATVVVLEFRLDLALLDFLFEETGELR